jgi:small subunit ribosomal protein S16
MAVAIRFSRQGKKRSPFYRIVAADKRCARDGRFIELLGTYHPITKVLKLDTERYDKWRKVGAQPSGTLAAVIRRTARAAAASSGPSGTTGGAGAKKTA